MTATEFQSGIRDEPDLKNFDPVTRLHDLQFDIDQANREFFEE